MQINSNCNLTFGTVKIKDDKYKEQTAKKIAKRLNTPERLSQFEWFVNNNSKPDTVYTIDNELNVYVTDNEIGNFKIANNTNVDDVYSDAQKLGVSVFNMVKAIPQLTKAEIAHTYLSRTPSEKDVKHILELIG